VLYCYSQVCHLAATVAIRLAGEGYPVKELEGGFEGWKEHDLPVETGAPASGQSDASNGAYASNRNDDREEGAGAIAPADRSPRQENL
jgi:3-mercaptopyruvate sulfurtransferase SseA